MASGTKGGKGNRVGVIMGSKSDWPVMSLSCEILKELKIEYEADVVSAHRTPDKLYQYAQNAEESGLKVIIAGAGGSAHLPGMVASKTMVPVVGVPIETSSLKGLDSLLSIVQMPRGIPVGTLAIGQAGAVNAALFAASIISLGDAKLYSRLKSLRAKQTNKVRAVKLPNVIWPKKKINRK